MDTAIYDGDFLIDSRGRPIEISGMQEILQRALIRLSVRKGSFVYDTDFGSRLHTLKGSSNNIRAKALALSKEALKPMDNLMVDDVEVRYTNNGENLLLNVLISVYDNQGEVAITL